MSMRNPNPVIAAFTTDQASRLTGVTPRQLRNWADDGFFVPSIDLTDTIRDGTKLYSFRDIVCLRVLNSLRNEAKISLQHLRGVKENLSHMGEDVWAKTTLYILGRRVVFENPKTGGKEDGENGQGVLQIPLQVIIGNVSDAVRAMRQRDESSQGRIDSRKFGAKKPVIAGTRVSVRTIQEFHEAGFSIEHIIEQYPSLTSEDIIAAINYRIAA
jgi:uncharacterized protein (DUF433 family)/DNA-binding transcriptional MerR regulator